MNYIKKWIDGIRSGNPLHSTPTLYHLRYIGSCQLLFKCYRWTRKRVLSWDEFLNLNHALKPLVTWHIIFVSKT